MTRPTRLDDVRGVPGEFRAGGTDLIARRRLGLSSGPVVDLGGIAEMWQITDHGEGLRIGALTRIATVATDPVIAQKYPALALTAGSLATPQVRAVGTLGGNLLQRNRCPYYRHPEFSCFKSGGDTCPARPGDHRHGVIFDLGSCVAPHPSSLAMALLAYDAEVDVFEGGRRSVEALLGDGSDGTRDHQLEEGAVLVAVQMPPAVAGEKASYRRATARALAEWPTVEAVCRLVLDDESTIAAAAVGVGGVAPVPLRCRSVEESLVGVPAADEASIRQAAGLATDGATPLPMTGHKAPLLEVVVADALLSALAGGGESEIAVGERGLPAPRRRG